jgi:hypothetical protein
VAAPPFGRTSQLRAADPIVPPTVVPARWDDRPVQVTPASPDDIGGFLSPAADVENWFGPMIDDPDFHAVLHRNIQRGTALVVRARNSTGLLGGLLTVAGHRPAG